MDNIKLFLFDLGIGVKKEDQVGNYMIDMITNLIEKDKIDAPPDIIKFYNKHRKFDLNGIIDDVVYEMLNDMEFKDIKQFSKINKYYYNLCKTISSKYPSHDKLYTMDKLSIWIENYDKYKKAHVKTTQLLNIMEYEKKLYNMNMTIYLIIADGFTEKFKLIKQYEPRCIKYILLKHAKNHFKKFKVILLGNYLEYFFNDKSVGMHVDIYKVIYRFYYFYDYCYHIVDDNNIPYTEKKLIQNIPSMTVKNQMIARNRLAYIKMIGFNKI